MRVYALLLALSALPLLVHAQSCDCGEELSFVIEKIENNYAGFRDKVTSSNDREYKGYKKEYFRQAKKVSDPFVCAALITKWIRYFNDGHIQLDYDRVDLGSLTDEEKRNLFSNSRSIPKWTEQRVMQYLDKGGLDDIEGIWENSSGRYRTAIIKTPKSVFGSRYIGVLIGADSVFWMPGQVKVEIFADDKGRLMADYYYRDHHPETVGVKLYGNAMVEFDGITQWKRKYPQPSKSTNAEIDPDYFVKNHADPQPSFGLLDDQTTVITLPSFEGQQAILIDSLITVHFDDITSRNNLIIDLRGNEGGSDFCYAPIIPILYTSPIFTDGVSIFASADNITSWEVLLDDPKFSPPIKARIRELVNKMKANIDGFVEIPGEETKHDRIYDKPENIGIIIDEHCASSAEQFILSAKQSSKVTVFGKATAGVLDYANMRSVELSQLPYKLFYATSRSNRLPENPIDEVGISPDIVLNADQDWVKEVAERLKQLAQN